MRLILTTVAATALIAGGAIPAFAHGGAYRGPGGEVPADSRAPEDPPPPPDEGGPGTPGGEEGGGPETGGGDVGGGPTTGGEGGGGPDSGGGGGNPPPGGGGGGGGPTTGSKPKAKGPGYEDWTFWWNYNKDSLLSLKKLIKERQSTANTGMGVNAFGPKASVGTILSATDAKIQAEIVPVLRALLYADPKTVDSDIQSAAELALAKIGDPEVVSKLIEISQNEKKAFDKIVVESASLALGLLQKDTPDIREYLIDLVGDEKRDAGFSRPFAAVSLGLIGDKNDKDGAVGTAFLKVIEAKETGKDIKPAVILGLGLLENDKYAEALLKMAKTTKTPSGKSELSDQERSHAISSLGRIGRAGLDKAGEETAVADYLILQLTDKKARGDAQNILRSAAIALGQIGAKATDQKLQKKILGTLKQVVKDTDDNQEKHFAIIAIGRLGAAKGMDAKFREECIETLRKDLDNGKQLTPTFAAMGLGIIGKSMTENGIAMDDEAMKKPIREKFKDTKEARSRGAYAVASGLLRDSLAVPALRDVLKEKGADAKLRGYAALGLGMIGPDSGAREDIKNVLMNETDKDLRVQAAIAAGLLADSAVIEDLIKILKDKNQSQYVLGSVALALGQLGDERAIQPLIDIAQNTKDYPNITRALATVSLGQIGDRRDVPVLARVSTDINYRDQASYEVELLTIL